MIHRINSYKNKKVIVRANGITYRGILKGITEDSLHLLRIAGWTEIPMNKITSIKGEDEEDGFQNNKFVDKSFFNDSDETENS